MEPANDTILIHLMESIERLHRDLDKVELWLGALNCFQKPVPDYQPNNRYLLTPLPPKNPRPSRNA